jgi:hypothetical protein
MKHWKGHDGSLFYDPKNKKVLADLNAQIGNEEHYSPAKGKKSLSEVTNDNGDWLISLHYHIA